MRVSVEQSGGFTGIPLTASVDAATLSAEEAMRLRELVEAAEFFQLPERIPGPVYPDQFEYAVTVQENGRAHKVTVNESALPDPLRALLDWVRKAAGRR